MTAPPRVAIVGCGRVGQKRAAALGDAKLVACADIDADRARARGTPWSVDWREVIARDDVDIVVVSTFNSLLA